MFSCVWKTNFVADDMRPDRLGVICKWVADGAMQLIPIEEKVSMVAVERWKAFAKKMNQTLRLYDRRTDSVETLVHKRGKAA